MRRPPSQGSRAAEGEGANATAHRHGAQLGAAWGTGALHGAQLIKHAQTQRPAETRRSCPYSPLINIPSRPGRQVRNGPQGMALGARAGSSGARGGRTGNPSPLRSAQEGSRGSRSKRMPSAQTPCGPPANRVPSPARARAFTGKPRRTISPGRWTGATAPENRPPTRRRSARRSPRARRRRP